MAQLRHIPENPEELRGRSKIYFACHPQDYELYFEETVELLKKHSGHSAIFYYAPDEEVTLDQAYYDNLENMNLLVIPVTKRLLSTPNRAMDVEVPFVQGKYPVLPLVQKPGLESLYQKKFGEIQFLEVHSTDPTALPFEDKLTHYLKEKLVGDKLADKIRASFDAYVFLSYRKKDRAYAQKLMQLIHRDPLCRDIAIWYDEFLTPGEKFSDTIRKALEKSKLFALVVTPNLLEKPNYVMDYEYDWAHKKQMPILPAEMVLTSWEQLRQYYADIPNNVNPADEATMTSIVLEAMRDIALRENDKDPKHNFLIGLAYLAGIDVEIDRRRAVELITDAAEANLTEAIEKLISMYETGDGVPVDFRESIRWRGRLVELARADYERFGAENNPNYLTRYMSCLISLAEAKKKMRDLSGTEEVLLTALPVAEKGMAIWPYSSYDLRLVYEKLAALYMADVSDKNLDKAKEMAQKQLDLLLKDEDGALSFGDAFRCYLKLATIAKRQNDISEARRWNEKCIALMEEEGIEGPALGQGYIYHLYHSMGDVCIEEGNAPEARKWYEKALERIEALVLLRDDYKGYLSSCYTRMALLCKYEVNCDLFELTEAQTKTKYREAMEWSLKNIALHEDADNLQTVDEMEDCFIDFYNLARDCIIADAVEEAYTWIVKAYELTKQMEQARAQNMECYMFRIAVVYGDYQKHYNYLYGEQSYIEALKYEAAVLASDSFDTKRELCVTYGKIGGINRECDIPNDAAIWYKKQLALAKKLAESGLQIDVERLGYSYYDLGSVKKSRKLIVKALEVFEGLAAQYPDTPRYGRIVKDLQVEFENMRLSVRIRNYLRKKKEGA